MCVTMRVIGHQQIGPALGAWQQGHAQGLRAGVEDAARGGDVLERPVAPVAEEPAGFAAVGLGQRVGQRRHHLRDLHQRALEPAECCAQIGGMTRAVDLDPEQPFGAQPRRESAHRTASLANLAPLALLHRDGFAQTLHRLVRLARTRNLLLQQPRELAGLGARAH